MGTHLLYEKKKCGDPWTVEITEQEEVDKQPAPRKPQFLQVQHPAKGDNFFPGSAVGGGGVIRIWKWDRLADWERSNLTSKELIAPCKECAWRRCWLKKSLDETWSSKTPAEEATEVRVAPWSGDGRPRVVYFTCLRCFRSNPRVFHAAREGWGAFYSAAVFSGWPSSGATCRITYLPQVSSSHKPQYMK